MTIYESSHSEKGKKAPADTRLHREDPERQTPIRKVDSLFTQSTTNGEKEEMVNYAVDLGYRVIEDQISKGQKLASQWAGHGDGTANNADWSQIAGRALNAYKDLGAVVVDAVEKMVDANRNAETQAPPSQPHQSVANVAIQVRSCQTALVDLQLNLDTGVQLCVPALHSSDQQGMLGDVSITRNSSGGLTLAIDVPDETNPGVYTGVVVDTDTYAPQGTLSIRISK